MNLAMGNLDYHLPTRIIFGWGKVNEIASLAEGFGKHALLVTMKDLPHGQRVRDLLNKAGIAVTFYDGCEPEPSIEGIDAAWASLQDEEYDAIVGVGGGSAIDTAKAFKVLRAGGGSAWEYTMEIGDERRPIPFRPIPLIAVPTTAGTGAEVTWNAVLRNKSQKKKAPIRDPFLFPTVALVDPELTLTMPARLTASTGFDAFTHAHERYLGTDDLSALAHQLCVTGMKLVIDNLETAIKEPGNREARTAMSWAATQNCMVIATAGGESALHIFGLPIGAVRGVPHGQALAVVTAPITRLHVHKKPDRARELAGLFGIDTSDLGIDDLEARLVSALVDWIDRIGLPSTMGGHGIGAEAIDTLIQSISMPRVRGALGSDFTTEDIREIYQRSL